jgi:TRAP-type transport system periplasmic protein
MMWKNSVGLGVVLSAAILWFLAVPAYSVETLRMGHHHAVNSVIDNTAKKFAELVEQKTRGQVIVRIFPGAQLGGEMDAFDLVNQGGIDATITSLGYADKFYKPIAVTTLPFVFRDWGHATKAMQGDFGSMLKKGLLENSNVNMVGVLELGPRDMLFTSRDPISDLAGMKGVKMRSPEMFVYIRMFELLGAKPTPIAWGEAYTALQTGVVAGLDSPAQQAMDMKFYEVCKSLVKTNHIFLDMIINVNKNRVAKLGPENQKAIEAAGQEAAAWSNATIIKPAVAAAYGDLGGKGVKVAEAKEIGKWAAAMKPLWDEVAAKYPGADKALKALLEIK